MNLIEQAQEYLSEGFNPLPLWATKAPMLPKGHQYLYEPAPEQDIPRLFKSAEKIGIACGDVSNGFECMDFDAKDGQPIREVFNKFMANSQVKHIVGKHNLPVVRTPSGGYHLYYRHTEKKKPPMHLATWSDGKVMIETRGDGSYVATIPSDGYEQLAGSSIVEISRLDKEERDALIIVAESFTQKIITKKENLVKGNWPDKFDTSTVWGKFNEEGVDEAKECLIERGWEYICSRDQDGVEYWQRPGKNERMPVTGGTFGKCYHMFYCWTDGADGFSQRTAYTPFDIFIIHRHNGNKRAAIEELENRYGIRHYKVNEPPISEPDPSTSGFPIDVFPQVVQDFITELNSTLNFSKDFVSIAMMSAIATLNGNKYKLRVKTTWHAPSIFWFAAVGEPGTMKSHPISLILDPIQQIDKIVKKSYDHEYSEYERQLVESKNKKLVKKPKFKQIRISDVTLESLHDVHSINKRGLCYYKDELVGFIKNMNQYRNGSDEEFWLESFNNKSYIVNRVSKQVNLIEDTHINIIGTIQPSVLSRITKDHDGNGLTDRILYTCSEENIYPISNKDIDPKWIEWWAKSLFNANRIFKYMDSEDSVILEMDEPLRELYRDIDVRVCNTQNSEDISDSMKNYLGKSKTYLPRFVLLLALFDALFNGHEPTIDRIHISNADRVMQYFVDSSKAIFNRADKVNEINEVAGVQKGKTRSELIIILHDKGFKNSEIAKKIGVSKAYVGQFLKSKNM